MGYSPAALRDMTDALRWVEADPELLEHFNPLMAANTTPGNPH